MKNSQTLAAGAVVTARGRRWRVVDIEPGIDCAVARLAREDAPAPPLALITPFDHLHSIRACGRPRWAHRRAVAASCAAALMDAHPWAGLWTALRSDIRVLDYQLEPALAVLRGECTRVLLADEVGLGKTIQAALIVNELRARREAERVLIVTPAGLRDQWERELRDRSGVIARRVDAATLAAAGRLLPPWIDYWSLPGVSLASIDLVKRPEVLAQLGHAIWDVVVVDEAHHAAESTDRGTACLALCARARYVVLITATPHGGDPRSFQELLRLGELPGDAAAVRIFRRTRADAGFSGAVRATRRVRVLPSDAEAEMHRALDRYTRRVWREMHDASDVRLAMIVLRKRGLSAPASLARSARRRLAALSPSAAPGAQLALAFDDLDGETPADDHERDLGLGVPGLRDADLERALLEAVVAAADRAEGGHGKLRALARALDRLDEPVIVFTEYRDTLQYLEGHLGQRTSVACLHGGLLPAARRAAMQAFLGGAARVLLATDAAAEGLNLHRCCRWVIHFELPWSTVRLEQRIGRVDRIGQSRRVHSWCLVAAGTEEERILARLDARQALGEQEIARLVFGDDAHSWQRPEHRSAVAASARKEARRLGTLARLRLMAFRDEPRPLQAVVRSRGAFGSLRGRDLTLFRGLLADLSGARVATECAALASQGGSSPQRRAGRILGARLRRSELDRGRFARAALARAAALESRLRASRPAGFQRSLFDRRAEQKAENDERALARARESLQTAVSRARHALEGGRARIAAIATFRVR